MGNNFFENFDKVIFLTLSTSSNRITNIQNIINKYNIDNSFIYYSTKLPEINLKCSKLFPSLKTDYYDNCEKSNHYIYANNFSVSINHLNIIKISYELGLNNILICEDDINFIDNNLLNKISKLLPVDYDIIKFTCDEFAGELPKLSENINENLFTKISLQNSNYSTRCYAISRSGMKKYIDWMMETNHLCEDLFFNELLKYYNNDINIYKTNYCICPFSENMTSSIL